MNLVGSHKWGSSTLDEMVSEDAPICYGVLKPGEYDPEGVRLVRIVDLGGDAVNEGALFRINPALDKEFSRSRLRGGELLLSIQGTIGRVALAGNHLAGANISRTIARIDLKNNLNARFYRHWLLSERGQKKLLDTVVGTTRASLNLGDVREIQLPVPPTAEQARIAEVLDTMDEAIRRSELVCDKRSQLLQGIAQRLMTCGVDEAGRVRDPERFPERFKTTVLGRFPGSWQIKPIRDLGKTITGSTPPSSVPGVWGDGLPFVTPSEITEGGAVLPSSRFVTEKGRPFVSPLPPGTLLTVCIGSTLGKMALLHQECATNQQINATIPGPGIDGTFLEQAIRLQMGRLLAMAGLQAVPIVNRTQFESLTVTIAPPEEQRRIGEIIRSQQALIHKEETVLACLRAIKTGLATDLLTGRVRATTGAIG